MSLFNRSLFIISLISIFIFPGLTFADCNCRADYISTIGQEFIADSCPPDDASDNTEYHYIVSLVRCTGVISLYAPYGDLNAKPGSL